MLTKESARKRVNINKAAYLANNNNNNDDDDNVNDDDIFEA